MSLVSVKDPSEFMQCPYEPSHVVSAIRYTRHIVKCQRNHPSVELVSCPFNHQHRYRQEENAKHLTTCPDRVSVERDFFTSKENSGNVTVPTYDNTHVEAEEDWDRVAESSGYNPALKMNKLQFHNPSTTSYLKPAEKRAYRQQLQTRGFSQDDFICQRNEKEDEDEVNLVPLVLRTHIAERTAGLSRPASQPAASTSHTSRRSTTTSMSSSASSRSDAVQLKTMVREQVLDTTCQPSSSRVGRGIGRGTRKFEGYLTNAD